MTTNQPRAVELEPAFSSPDAVATTWPEARDLLDGAQLYWLTTVRPDGRPHVTPIAGIVIDDAVWFTTGETEAKARNLATNDRCVVTTGTNAFDGIDVVVEGIAERVTDAARLRRLADAYVAKYGETFVFEVADGGFRAAEVKDLVLAFAVRATKAFAFGKGDRFSQTRYRF